MIRILTGLWKSHQRRIDVFLLWPICKREAPDLPTARMAFQLHMEIDPAYSDLDPDDVPEFLARLP